MWEKCPNAISGEAVKVKPGRRLCKVQYYQSDSNQDCATEREFTVLNVESGDGKHESCEFKTMANIGGILEPIYYPPC